jgi:hypothetical protein
MFAAYVFTIIESQDMQERNRLGPVAVTPGARCLPAYSLHRSQTHAESTPYDPVPVVPE